MKRPCLDGCGTLTARSDHRCQPCAAKRNQRRDALRGTTTKRGYGAPHQRARERMLPHAVGQPCPRCGELMLAGQDLDAGHSTPLRFDPSSRADRIEHADCNRGARD